MKLFKSLLVAPATLGLLAPMSVTANELNITDVSGYSSSEEIQNIKEFSPELAITNSRVDGLEARFNDFEAAGFSETTTASFGSNFYVGAVDEAGGLNETTTFSYDFSMDLNTSFTGEDSFDVAIIGGNVTSGNTVTSIDAVMVGDGTGDVLTLDGISYTFPVGDLTVIAGDGVGVDDLNSGACTYSALTDIASDCGTSSVGGTADSAVAASYDFGNGFTAAGGIGFGTATVGMLSKEDQSTVGLELAYAADTYALSLAYTDNDEGPAQANGDTSFYSIQGAYTPESAPYSISAGYEFDDDDADSLFLGLTTEAGPGSLSIAATTQAIADDHDDNYAYEVSYAYDVNDGMTITPGIFIIEQADPDDSAFGVVVKTSFSF